VKIETLLKWQVQPKCLVFQYINQTIDSF